MNSKFSDSSYDVTKMMSTSHGDGCLLTLIISNYPFNFECDINDLYGFSLKCVEN